MRYRGIGRGIEWWDDFEVGWIERVSRDEGDRKRVLGGLEQLVSCLPELCRP